ncbi:hypothetical protein [Halorubrum salinum]|uniref:hypothetical protein n=1 Tax=Halorubrum salinum TaxID=767517 RepID=UPI002111A806|nr:hypothetical protein [Halorubrum salinum]
MPNTTDETTEEIGTDRLNDLAEEHGLDVEAVRELVETADSECWECGRSTDEIEPIESYPVGDGDTARLCHECYGEYLDNVTTLSPLQANVWALYETGMEPAEIDRKLEKNSGQSQTAIRRAQSKALDAREEIKQLRATVELIGGGDDAE